MPAPPPPPDTLYARAQTCCAATRHTPWPFSQIADKDLVQSAGLVVADCGAGIGRIAENLLLKYAKEVDVVEPLVRRASGRSAPRRACSRARLGRGGAADAGVLPCVCRPGRAACCARGFQPRGRCLPPHPDAPTLQLPSRPSQKHFLDTAEKNLRARVQALPDPASKSLRFINEPLEARARQSRPAAPASARALARGAPPCQPPRRSGYNRKRVVLVFRRLCAGLHAGGWALRCHLGATLASPSTNERQRRADMTPRPRPPTRSADPVVHRAPHGRRLRGPPEQVPGGPQARRHRRAEGERLRGGFRRRQGRQQRHQARGDAPRN